jgi:DNA-binding NtrC family response regulator
MTWWRTVFSGCRRAYTGPAVCTWIRAAASTWEVSASGRPRLRESGAAQTRPYCLRRRAYDSSISTILPAVGQTLETIEQAAIEQTLRRFDGNKTKAARALGIAASTLYEKIRKYTRRKK